MPGIPCVSALFHENNEKSHKNGKIVGFEDQSKNRGRKEKSRLKKKK